MRVDLAGQPRARLCRLARVVCCVPDPTGEGTCGRAEVRVTVTGSCYRSEIESTEVVMKQLMLHATRGRLTDLIVLLRRPPQQNN